MEVHKQLGAGFLEAACQEAWAMEFNLRYHLNNSGCIEPALLFSVTNFTNFSLFCALIRA